MLSGVLGGSGMKKMVHSHGHKKSSAWTTFLKANMKKAKAAHPTASHAEIMQMLGQAYHNQ
jgi:hypothetical protein